MPRDTTYYKEWTNEGGTRLRLELIPASMDYLSDPAAMTPFPRGSIVSVGEQESGYKDGIAAGLPDGDSLSIVVDWSSLDADLKSYLQDPEGSAWSYSQIANDRRFIYFQFTERTKGSNLWILYSDRNTGASPTFVEFVGVQRITPTTKSKKTGSLITKEIELIDATKFAIESIVDFTKPIWEYSPISGFSYLDTSDPLYSAFTSGELPYVPYEVGLIAAPYGKQTLSEYGHVYARDPNGDGASFAKLDLVLKRYVYAVSVVLKILTRRSSTTASITTNTLPVTFYQQQISSSSSSYEPLYARGSAISAADLWIAWIGRTTGLGVNSDIPERLGGYPSKFDYLRELLESFVYKAARQVTKSGTTFSASFAFVPLFDRPFAGTAASVEKYIGDSQEWEEGAEAHVAASTTLKAYHPDDTTELEYRKAGTYADGESAFAFHLHNVAPIPTADSSSSGAPFYVEGIPDGLIYYFPVPSGRAWAVHSDTTVDLGGSFATVTTTRSTVPDPASTKGLAGMRGYAAALQLADNLPYAIAKTFVEGFSSRYQNGYEIEVRISDEIFPYAIGSTFVVPVPDASLTGVTTEAILTSLSVNWKDGTATAKLLTKG